MLRHGTTSATTTLILTILIAILVLIQMIPQHQAWAIRRCQNHRRLQPRRRNQDFTGSSFMVHHRLGHLHQGHCHTYWLGLAHRRRPYSKARSTFICREAGARPEPLLRSHACPLENRYLMVQHQVDRPQCSLIDSAVSCIQVLILPQLPMSWQLQAEMMVCALRRKGAPPTIMSR